MFFRELVSTITEIFKHLSLNHFISSGSVKILFTRRKCFIDFEKYRPNATECWFVFVRFEVTSLLLDFFDCLVC